MCLLLNPQFERRLRRPASGLLLSLCLAVPLFVFAQGPALYKCTSATGTQIYSDRPCAPEDPSIAAKGDGEAAKRIVNQEVLQLPGSATVAAGPPSAASIERRCSAPGGTPITVDAAMRERPERQREAFKAIVQGLALSGLKRDDMQASTLHLDDRQTLVWCLPQAQRGLHAYLVENSGHIVELTRSGRVKSHNDANDPITLAGRCGDLVTSCFQPGTSGHSLDQCFAAAPACPVGPLDPPASCCPQTCKTEYQRERASGTDPLTAMLRVLHGDGDSDAVSTCVTRGSSG